MMGMIKKWRARLTCLLHGHPCEATGWRGYKLVEWQCSRCGSVFISHSDYGTEDIQDPVLVKVLLREGEAIRVRNLKKEVSSGT